MARDNDSERRDAILDAALALFAELGFHGTSVPEVADKAGIATGTIYRYFDGKEALVNAVFQREKGALGQAMMSAPCAGVPWRKQFHSFWRAMIEFARKNPHAFAFLELHHHAPYLDAKSREIEAMVLTAARGFFEETARQEITKPVAPNLLIAIVWGAFAGLVKGSRTCELTLDDATIDAAENCVWEAIRR